MRQPGRTETTRPVGTRSVATRSIASLRIASLLLGLAACSYDRDRGETTAEPDQEVAEDSIGDAAPGGAMAYQVFLENSGSMDGYVRGVTNFEDDIYQLLVDISYVSNRLTLFYINSQPIPYIYGTEKFINNLEPDEFQQRGGNRSNSDLNLIFNKILRRTSDQRVMVLISDFILSLGKGDTESLLNNQRISVYNTFRKRLEDQPFATYIVKMHSDFTGNYYTKDDQPVYLNGVRRPYYLCFVGPTTTVQSLPETLRTEALPGFAQSYTLLPTAQPVAPFYTVLNNTYKQGSFRTDRDAAGRGPAGYRYVHGIEDVRASRRDESEGTFGFSVATDLSQVSTDADYLLDPANYQVEGYRLDTVLLLSQTVALHPRDQSMTEGKATHVLVFSTTSNRYADLRVVLKKQTPHWVEQTHTTDDTGIKGDTAVQDQTFGFGYLVAGVEEAYRSVFGQGPYFTLEVSVNR